MSSETRRTVLTLAAIFRQRDEGIQLLWLGLFALLLLVVAFIVLVLPQRSYTTDYLIDEIAFTSAAYRAYWGQVPSVDFSSHFGALTFYPAALGFRLGLPPGAVLAFGQFLVSVFLLGTAVAVAYPRLSLPSSYLILLFVFLFAVTPTGIGALPNNISFGLYYDRYGWAALTLVLVFYVESHNRSSTAFWRDAIVLGLLLLFLFYTIINFALVALVFTAANAVTSPYKRRVCAIALALFVIIFAFVTLATTYNSAYFRDIAEQTAIAPQYVSVLSKLPTRAFFGNETVIALTMVSLLLLCLAGRRRVLDVAFTAGAIASALVLTTQSLADQPRNAPLLLAVIACFEELARRAEPHSWGTSTQWWPQHAASLSILGLMFVFLSEPALRHSYVLLVYTTKTLLSPAAASKSPLPLRGFLLDPPSRSTLANVLGTDVEGRAQIAMLRKEARTDIKLELEPPEYLVTIADGIALLKGTIQDNQTIAVFDVSDPFSFALGLRPTRYGYPVFVGGPVVGWGGSRFRQQHPAPERLFSNADYTMVPRVPFSEAHLDMVQEVYGPYLRANFQPLKSSAYWDLWARKRVAE